MNRLSSKFLLIFLFTVTVLISFFISILSVIVIVSIISTTDRFPENISNKYYFLKRNYEKKSTYIDLPNIIEKNEHLSYNNELYNTNSNFGKKEEYECIGSCFCDSEKRRRTSLSGVISRGIIPYLVISISSVVAYQKAKKYFESKCIEELSEQCNNNHLSSSITSEVYSCSPSSSSSKSIKKIKFKSFFDVDGKDEDEKRSYFCYGNCVRNLKLKKQKTRSQFAEVKCEELKREGTITVHNTDLIFRKTSKKATSTKFITTAKHKFSEVYLNDFCKQNSALNYDWEGKTKNPTTGKEYRQQIKFMGYGCVGRSNYGGKKSAVRNIKCRQVDPEVKSSNWKWRLDKFNEEKKEWDKI